MDKLLVLAFILIVAIIVIQIVIKITSILLRILLWLLVVFLFVYIINFFVLPKFGIKPLFSQQREKITQQIEQSEITKKISQDIDSTFEGIKIKKNRNINTNE